MNGQPLIAELTTALARQQFTFLTLPPRLRAWKQATYNTLLLADANPDPVVVRVRIYQDDGLDSTVEGEHALLETVPSGLGPRPLFVDGGCREVRHPYRIETLCPGSHPAKFEEQTIDHLADAFARLHGPIAVRRPDESYAPAHALLPLLQVHTGENHVLGELLRAGVRAVRAYRSDFSTPRLALTHNDAHLGNVLDGPDGCYLLDWEQAGEEDPALDVAVLFSMSALMNLTDAPLDLESRRQFCERYTASTGDTDVAKRARVLEPLIVALQLAGWHSKLERAALLPPHLSQREAIHEMQRGIARGLQLAHNSGLLT